MHNCTEKEEKDVIKRSLYLLKKIFIIWPHTQIKFDTINKQCINLIKQDKQQQLENSKFNYTLLNIINIMIEFEKPENILNNLETIMGLLNYPNLNNSFVNNDNPYLIKLVIDILKRLIYISIVMFPQHPNSIQFIQNLDSIIDNGL